MAFPTGTTRAAHGRPRMARALIATAMVLLTVGAATGSAALFNGSDRGDRIGGTTRGDVIRSGGGNDLIRSGRGPDTVVAGSGNDRVFGEGGNDRISGNAGKDRLSGGPENDRLFGGSGDDRLEGGSGADLLSGARGRDILVGGKGVDSLAGGAGADRLAGGGGNDRLSGGTGADALSGGTGRDRLDGGPGRDILVGGGGDDTLIARDGLRESVRCGPGRDLANVDYFETTITDCERVTRPPVSRALATGAPAKAFGGVELTVGAVVPNATPEVLANNAANLPPGPGEFYLLASITVRNGSKKPHPIEVGRIAASGDRVPFGQRSCGVLANPLPVRTLAPGEAISGDVCWRMNFSDFGSIVLIVDSAGATANGIAMRLG